MQATLEIHDDIRYIHKEHMTRVAKHSTAFHKHIEILCATTKGGLRTCINGENIVLQQGDLYIVFPYVAHSNELFPYPADIIMVDPDALPQYRDIFLTKHPANPHIKASDVPSAKFLFEKIIDTSDSAFSYDITSGYLAALLGEILQTLTLTSGERVDSTALQKILLFCTENYKQDINLEDVAKNAHVSKSYVTYVFTKKLGYSFRKFINDLRIDHAKTLLIETNMSVTDIMLECGYQNQSTFNKAFIERCGMVPIIYRRVAPPTQ